MAAFRVGWHADVDNVAERRKYLGNVGLCAASKARQQAKGAVNDHTAARWLSLIPSRVVPARCSDAARSPLALLAPMAPCPAAQHEGARAFNEDAPPSDGTLDGTGWQFCCERCARVTLWGSSYRAQETSFDPFRSIEQRLKDGVENSADDVAYPHHRGCRGDVLTRLRQPVLFGHRSLHVEGNADMRPGPADSTWTGTWNAGDRPAREAAAP